MKIVVVASLAFSLVNFRGRLLADMVAAGHEVTACAPDEDAEVIAALAEIGISYRVVPMSRAGISPIADLRTLAALIALFAREQPDVVLAYTQKPIIYSGIASRLRRPRFFAMVSGLGHAFSDDSGFWLRPLVATLYRLALARAETIFVFNRDDEGEMLRNRMMPATVPVIQLPGSGVDLDHYAAAAAVPQGPLRFVMVARLLRSKGLMEYIEAARRIRARYPEIRFALLGPRDPNPHGVGQAEIDGWAQTGVIDYLGEARDVRPFLAAAHVFVLPSWYREGLPRTILEAMATGRAVITTDMPGCRDAIEQGVTGLIVEPRNIAALEAAMMEFVRGPDLAATMGAQARQAVAGYSVERVNAMVLAAIQSPTLGQSRAFRQAGPGVLADQPS